MIQIAKTINEIHNFINKNKHKIKIIDFNIEGTKIKEDDILSCNKKNNKEEGYIELILKRKKSQKKILEFKYKWTNVK